MLLSSAIRSVLGSSFNTSAFPINCGATGFLPERRDSSTRRRMRRCSRSSRQACQRAWAFCRIPSFSTFPIGPFGPLAQACAPAKENRVVMKIATTSKAGATRYAPRFRLASNPLETSAPTKPPAGMAPRIAGMKDRRETSAGRERRSNPYPASVATCESIARLRNQRQPRTRIAAGSKNAANPNIWKKRSAP